EIIEEIQVEGEPQSIAHINFTLVRADSPKEAYDKAIELGKELECSYKNTDSKFVTIIFRGLRDLNVIHDELEHGAELIYQEKIDLTSEQIVQMVREKGQLSIFLPMIASKGLNYMPKDIAEELEKHFGVDQVSDDES